MRRRTKDLLKQIQGLSNLPSAADKNPALKFVRGIRSVEAYPYRKGRCRRCEGELPPRKRTFCSEVCAYDLMIRCNPSEAKKWVRVRDKGICIDCGLDTKVLKVKWETNHIIPVAEGGGHCGLGNYETLCQPCHRVKTSELMKRLRKTVNSIHVVYSKEDKAWAIKLNGEVFESGFKTKKSAVVAGTTLAKEKSAELSVHTRGGKIKIKNSFGNDPVEIPG